METVFTKVKTGSELSNSRDLLDRLLSKGSSVSWISSTESPIDQEQNYIRAMTGRGSKIQAYGTSPASDQVQMRARFSTNGLGLQTIYGEARHQLSPIGLRLMRNLPKNQIGWRSRPYSVASFRLEVNELLRRVAKKKQNKQMLDILSATDQVSNDILQIKRNALLKRIKWDDATWRKYVAEHKDSSIVPGVKWAALQDNPGLVDDSFKREWVEMHRAAFEDHILTDQQWNVPFDLGIRARTSSETVDLESNYIIDEDRSRIVNFHMPASTLYSVVPDKTGMMDEIFTAVLDLYDINKQVMFPPVHGGEVYGAAAEALYHGEELVICLGDDLNIYNKGKQFAFDGVNWESQVGDLMGSFNRGSMSYFGGSWHLASGVWDTTILGSIASLQTFAKEEKNMMAGIDIPGIMERELMDEEVNFMLGLRYLEDPWNPRLQGLKLTVDRKEQSHTLPRGATRVFGNNYNEDEAMRWELAYYGTTADGGSVLDFLQHIKAEDFRGGSEQITGAVMSNGD